MIRRHPEEAPVIIKYPAFPGRVIKLSIEERAQFPVQVSGVVAGCLYALQWRLYGHDGEGYTVSLYTGKLDFDLSSAALNLTVPTGRSLLLIVSGFFRSSNRALLDGCFLSGVEPDSADGQHLFCRQSRAGGVHHGPLSWAVAGLYW